MSKKKEGRNVKDDTMLNVVSCIPVPQYKPRDNNLVNFLNAQKKDFEDEDGNFYDEATVLRNENRKRTDDMIRKAKEQLSSRKNSLEEAKENMMINEGNKDSSIDALSLLRQMEKLRNENDREDLKRGGFTKHRDQKSADEYFSGTKLNKGKSKPKHKPQRIVNLEELDRKLSSVPSGAVASKTSSHSVPSVPRTSCWHKKSGAELFVTAKQDLASYNGLGNEEELLKRAIAESLKCHQDETNRFAEIEKTHKMQEEMQRATKANLEEHTFSNVVPEFENWDNGEDSTIIQKTENEKWNNFPKYVDGHSKHEDPMTSSTVYFNGRVATQRTSFTMDENEKNHLPNNSDITGENKYVVELEDQRNDRCVNSNSNMKRFAMNKASDWKPSAFREKRREHIECEDWETERVEPTKKSLESKSKPLLHTTTTDRKTFSENRSSGRQTFSENRTSHRKTFTERSSDKQGSVVEDWDKDDDSTVYCTKTSSDFELKFKNVSSASTSRRENSPDKLKRDEKVIAFQETNTKNVDCENWECEPAQPAAYSIKKSTPGLELNYKNMANTYSTYKNTSETKRVDQKDWDDEPHIHFNQESRNDRIPGNNIKSKAEETHVNDHKHLNNVVSNSGWSTVDNREDDFSKKFQTTIASSCRILNDDGNATSNQTRFTYEVPGNVGETLIPLRDSSRTNNFVPSMINRVNEIEQVPVPASQNLFKGMDNISRNQMQHQLLINSNPSGSTSSCFQSDSLSTHSLMKTVNEIEATIYGTQVQNSSDQVPRSLNGVNINNVMGNQTRPTLLDSHIHNSSSQGISPHSDFIFSQTHETLPSCRLHHQISQAELVAKMNISQANKSVPFGQVSDEEIHTKMNIPQTNPALPLRDFSVDELLSKMNNAQANPSVPATQISGVSPEEMFLKMNALNFPYNMHMQSIAQNEMMARMNPLAGQSSNTLPPNFIPGIAANPLFMNMNRVSPPNQVRSAPNYVNLPETASTGMGVGINNMPGIQGHEVLQTSQPSKLLPDATLPMKPVLNVPENEMLRPLPTPHVAVGAIGSGLPNPTVDINSVLTNKIQQTLSNTQTLSNSAETVFPNSTSALNSVPENQGQQQSVPMGLPQAFTPLGPEAQAVPPFMMPLAASMMYNNYWLQASMLNPYMTNFYPQMTGINPANVPLGAALTMNMQNNNKMSVPTSSAPLTSQPGNLQSTSMPVPTSSAPLMNVVNTPQPGNLLGNNTIPMSASSVPHMSMIGAPQHGNMHNMTGVSGQVPAASHMPFIQPLSQMSSNPGILTNSGIVPVPAKGRGRLRH